jgi:hypothetical protein
MAECEGLPLSGHCPAVPQPTQLGGELTILVDDALSADSGPLSIDSISPPSEPSRKSCLLASSRCPYLDIDLRTEAALHSEEATDGALDDLVVLLLPDEIAAEIVEKFETAFEKV